MKSASRILDISSNCEAAKCNNIRAAKMITYGRSA
jgi:hypothetical protein